MANYRERAVLITYFMCRVKELSDYHLTLSDLEGLGDDAFDWGFTDKDVVAAIATILQDGAREEREHIADERRKDREEKAAAKAAAKAAKAGLHPVIEDVVIDGVAVSQ